MSAEPRPGVPAPRFAERTRGVAAYLGMAVSEASDGTTPTPLLVGTFDPPDHVLDDAGRTPTGIVAALVDSIGGLASGVAALPDWIVTTDLTLRRAPGAVGAPGAPGALRFETEVLRRGRSAVVTRTEVVGADGRTVASAWMTCAVLTPAGGPPLVERPVRPVPVPPTDDPVFALAPADFFALRDGEAPGSVLLDPVDRIRNPWGIVHGGATIVLAEAAAVRALAAAVAPPLDPVATDLVVHYLAPGRVGPLEAVALPLGRRGPDHLVRVSVLDRGADDRPVAEVVLTVADATADAEAEPDADGASDPAAADEATDR